MVTPPNHRARQRHSILSGMLNMFMFCVIVLAGTRAFAADVAWTVDIHLQGDRIVVAIREIREASEKLAQKPAV